MKTTMIAAMIAATGLTACQYIPGTEAHLKAEAQSTVAAMMKDPTSVQFSEVRVSPDEYVCGYANGRNSYGAYEGRSGFVVKGSNVLLENPPTTDNPGIDAMKRCWYRQKHAACMAGQNVLRASLDAEEAEDCGDAGQAAIRDQYQERVRELSRGF